MKITLHTALITGSSRGFGRAIAVKLAQEGVKKIAVHYLTRRDEAEKTLSQVRDAGAESVLVQGDTSDAKRAEEIVEEAAEKLGGCDIFVQSVIPTLDQIYEHTLATEVPLAKWQIAFDTQARAFFVGAPAAAKHMSPGGRILALSYTPGGVTGGWQPWVGMGSAKAAVESMCRYFAVALARHGITVNAVSPGPSDETTVIGQTSKEVQDALKEWVSAGWTPMRRRVTPWDVANVCALLCSEEASFLTGQTIVVDGGSSLMNPDFPLASTQIGVNVRIKTPWPFHGDSEATSVHRIAPRKRLGSILALHDVRTYEPSVNSTEKSCFLSTKETNRGNTISLIALVILAPA